MDHEILTDRMKNCFGFNGKELSLLRSYLADRTQSVQIGDHVSDPVVLATGVPQGSILGPLLFSLYLAPLEQILSAEDVGCHFYADDTQVYISFTAADCCDSLSKLAEVLTRMHNWFSFNKLSLNPDKTEYLLVGTKRQRDKIKEICTDVSFAGCTIQPKDCVRNLGILFDNELSFDKQVLSTSQTCFWHIRNLRRVRSSLDFSSTKLLANALVSSRIDFCNSLLYGIKGGLIRRLQSVQNSLARVVDQSVKYRDHISPTLRQLHWLPVHQRIIFKIALLTFKVLRYKEPQYLASLLHYLPDSGRRSSGKNLLVRSFCKSEKGRRAYSFAAPTVWNSLPQCIRDCTEQGSFRKKLKTHLFPG